MPRRILWPAVAWIGLTLLVLALIWALGGYDGLGFVGRMTLTLGVAVAMAVSVGLMSVILYGRRSRRDEAVRRMAHRDE